MCGFLTSPPMAVSGRAGAFWLSGGRKDPPSPTSPIRGASGGPPVPSSSPPEPASAARHGVLRPGWASSTLHVPWPPYTICRAAEQNFLINKQDLGFHVGEALTEEGPGLSPLSASGPANSSLPGRAKRREEGEPGQEHIFQCRVTGWQLAAAPLISRDVPHTGHRGLWARQPPGPLPNQA